MLQYRDSLEHIALPVRILKAITLLQRVGAEYWYTVLWVVRMKLN